MPANRHSGSVNTLPTLGLCQNRGLEHTGFVYPDRRVAMARLDWSQCPAVESVPGRVSGAWTFRNSRTPVKVVFENIEDGMTIEEIIEQYPVSREEIRAVLDFAAHSLDKEPSF